MKYALTTTYILSVADANKINEDIIVVTNINICNDINVIFGIFLNGLVDS